jgi:SWI/SNF-related matrix-associated actin-dependent regulator 1 of chromatin subfamily A
MQFITANLSRFKKHQKHGAVLALRRLKTHKAVYLAMDPGIGKTLTAMIIAAKLRIPASGFVYVCPGSLESNVEAEFSKWGFPKPIVVSDCMLESASLPTSIDFLVIDEAHRFKNEKTKRSVALFSVMDRAEKIVLLSGTPLPNTRPVELWTILKRCAPDVFGTDFMRFARAFCAPKKSRFGWNFSGFSRPEKFKSMLFSSFMVRIKKSEADLPKVTEGLIVVGKGVKPELQKLETEILKTLTRRAEGDLLFDHLGENPHYATYMKEMGKFKINLVLPIIGNFLEQGQKIIVFARHVEVLEALYTSLNNYKPVLIMGNTSKKDRQFAADKFQNDETCKLAVLSIGAASLGWNLQSADRVLFVETSWRDGDNEQATGKANRLGRVDKLICQYFVVKNSLDAKRMGQVLAKRINSI